MEKNPLDPLFSPRSVALFGASGMGAQVLANLRRGGFSGRILCVGEEAEGAERIDALADAKEPIDLALIACAEAKVPAAIRQCGEAGTGHAIVFSQGFHDPQRAETLARLARSHGVRFLGPHCTGIVRPWAGLDASILAQPTPKGRLALVTQSGALLSAISDWAGPHDLGFSALVALGQATDIDFGEVMHVLAGDPHTRAILVYLEGVRDASAFLSALRAAVRSRPVVVLKAGRHAGRADAAHTHTGALIGDDAVFEAALARVGAVRVKTFGQLFAAAEMLSAETRASGINLGVVTNAGGAGMLAADRAQDLRVALPAPSPATVEAIAPLVSHRPDGRNPLDLHGDATPAAYGAAVSAALADPEFDGVLAMLTPNLGTDPTACAKAVLDAIPKGNRKPLIACWMGETAVAEGRKLLSKAGIPDLATPERAVEAFSYLAQHARNRTLSLEMPGPLPMDRPLDIEGARMIVNAALAEGRATLTEVEARALLRAFRIPVNIAIAARDPEAALIAAETVGFPVAMKIASTDIPHKSVAGGVRVGIGSAAGVKRSFGEITRAVQAARPEARLGGVTVEKMVEMPDAVELVIGSSRDPVFGPAILFGAGGVAVEVTGDTAVALPPLTTVLARRLVRRTRVSRILERGETPLVDLDAVVDVLLRVSDMVCELPEIVELDINPLFASREGVLAVDASIRVARPPARHARYDHVAIHPWPRHLVTEDFLSDGTPLVIRPIRPEDAESEANFVKELSPEAKRFRFMGAMNELSREMLVRFTQIDYRREMALIAMAEIDGQEVQAGVARYVINLDNTSCEFAVVVSDRIRHQGIGTRLMKALMEAARDQGLQTIEGTVLRDNKAMLHLMGELGFETYPVPDDREIVSVRREL